MDLGGSADDLATWLNKRGRERWELVHYGYVAAGLPGLTGMPGSPASDEMILKRPVAE